MAKKKAKLKNTSTASKSSTISNPDLSESETNSSSSSNLASLKVCRLCESKDGPFLNIFDSETTTAKKIEGLMPFVIAENDNLPNTICFRCSAKLEEFDEFIQKCVKTQENLQNALGKKGSLSKTKTRTLWEEKLNKSNMSNDELCDALIKKAMEGIKAIKPVKDATEKPIVGKRELKYLLESQTFTEKDVNDEKVKSETSIEQVKTEEIEKPDKRVLPSRSSRSNNAEALSEGIPDTVKPKKSTNKKPQINAQEKPATINNLTFDTKENEVEKEKTDDVIIVDNVNTNKPEESKEPSKPFNIMDHVTTIKVHGVGTLFQCKLCNRNFLKKEVLMAHMCAKDGTTKADLPKTIVPVETPKLQNTVKYINTNTDSKKIQNEPIAKEAKTANSDKNVEPTPEKKPKPKIGPASRVKKATNVAPEVGMVVTPSYQPPPTTNPAASLPTVNFPNAPSLNSRYKLMAGPNNTYTLVEDKSDKTPDKPINVPKTAESQNSTKRKIEFENPVEDFKSANPPNNAIPIVKPGSSVAAIVPDIQITQVTRPYPVGLFQTVPHQTTFEVPVVQSPSVFTTPAMKKQSYTVVQTGNPSKLLISSKPQPIVEEVPKKRQKKSKPETPKDTTPKQPYSLTLEDNTTSRETGFFNFINVDPLLQPSYVLPTDNIIQESQISTSTPIVNSNQGSSCKVKDDYSCNLCGEKFSREKKLLTHIHSHYNQLDSEDRQREKKQEPKASKRKSKK